MALQPHPDTTPNPSVVIHRAGKDSVTLTPSRLEQWFASAAASIPGATSKDTQSLATEFLGYYGLKDSAQVIQFLKSPAGESILTMIGEQLAEVAAISEQQQHDVLQRYLLEKRVLAFLLMGLLERSEARIHKLNEQAQEIAEQIRTGDKSGQGTKDAQAQETLNTIEALKQTEKALQEQLESTLKESSVLEKAIEAVRQDMERVEQKYAIYNDQVDLAYRDIATIPLVSTSNKTIQASIDTIQKQIKAFTLEIERNALEIHGMLTEKIERDALEIDRTLTEEKRDAMVRDKIDRNNAINLRLGILHDMLAVINGEKVLYTAKGELTTEYHKADFIVPLKKKLVMANDTCYLLNADQDLATLSPEDRERSQRAYLRMRPELMGVRELIQHNQSLETEEFAGRQKTLAVRSDRMQDKIAYLARGLAEIQAREAVLTASLTPGVISNTPRPAPTPAPSMRAPASAPTTPSMRAAPTPAPRMGVPAPTPTPDPRATQTLTNSYQRIISLMGTTPTSREAIHRLQSDMSRLPLTPEMQRDINTLRPGEPIPPRLVEGLMARPDLASAWGAIPPSREEAAAASTAPTPFSTRAQPKPYS